VKFTKLTHVPWQPLELDFDGKLVYTNDVYHIFSLKN